MPFQIFDHRPARTVHRHNWGVSATLVVSTNAVTKIRLHEAYIVPDWAGIWVACPVSRREVPGISAAKLCWMMWIDVEKSIEMNRWVISNKGALDDMPQMRSALVRRGVEFVRGIKAI
ncbi:hypothetical protein ABNQ39_14890 [Azospirillum sp. A26]|uniref:hypothetical protein n=1 Tax=Azospirillum sp. A26 TaxID=3160607 RepID=UPI00366B9977